MRQGWGGRPVRVEQAQGILVAALGVLAGYYGYARDPYSPAQTARITNSAMKII